MGRPTDPAIEEIEAQLRESQFKVWDVETFLANRHRAKIEALTTGPKRRQIALEIATVLAAFVGYVTIITVAGAWVLTGQFPTINPPATPAPVYPLTTQQ